MTPPATAVPMNSKMGSIERHIEDIHSGEGLDFGGEFAGLKIGDGGGEERLPQVETGGGFVVEVDGHDLVKEAGKQG